MRVVFAVFSLIQLAGCGFRSSGPLVVATNWSTHECAAIEAKLAALPEPVSVRWIRVPADADPTPAAGRSSGIDLVLGGRPESHAQLALLGRTIPFDASDSRPWRTVLRSAPSDAANVGSGLSALTDSPAQWSAEYARLVLSAGEGPDDATTSHEVAISLVSGSRRETQAQRFLAALGETKPASPSASLLPTLLDATLVDCRDELHAALSIFNNSSESARFRAWMTEAPPWPPASITRLRTQENGMALIATLADHITPDSASRTWLLNAFDRVPHPIGGTILRELDEAEHGRLVNDDRFRAWLRSEWTAWASQRYRRVARGLQGSERTSS